MIIFNFFLFLSVSCNAVWSYSFPNSSKIQLPYFLTKHCVHLFQIIQDQLVLPKYSWVCRLPLVTLHGASFLNFLFLFQWLTIFSSTITSGRIYAELPSPSWDLFGLGLHRHCACCCKSMSSYVHRHCCDQKVTFSCIHHLPLAFNVFLLPLRSAPWTLGQEWYICFI